MPKRHGIERGMSYSEARAVWEAKHAPDQPIAAVVGCTRHTSLTCWNEPNTGRLVFVVDSVSQWPRIEETIATTHLVSESGPFASTDQYRLASRRFLEVIEERYGRLT
jgi:hypothetical protein